MIIDNYTTLAATYYGTLVGCRLGLIVRGCRLCKFYSCRSRERKTALLSASLSQSLGRHFCQLSLCKDRTATQKFNVISWTAAVAWPVGRKILRLIPQGTWTLLDSTDSREPLPWPPIFQQYACTVVKLSERQREEHRWRRIQQ